MPAISTIPTFPAVGAVNFNALAYAWALHMAGTFTNEVNALPTIVIGTGIDNTPIGATTRSTGAFTTLATSDNITVTKATGVPKVSLIATTGTNEAYFNLSTTGGGYYFGVENSAGSWFGATPYAGVVQAPAGKVIQQVISATPITTVSSTGIAVDGKVSSGNRGNTYGFHLPDWRVYNTSSGNSLAFSNFTTDLMTLTGAGVLELNQGQIKFPATAVPSADANTLDDYREASYTATATGLTTAPTGTVSFVRAGNIVDMSIPAIGGTSNSTTFTLTGGPTTMRPSAVRYVPVRIRDNSVAATAFGMAVIETSGTITIYKDATGAAFTAAGAKDIFASDFSYIL